MEQNTAWGQINNNSVESGLYGLVMPVMQCGSSGIAPGETRISYVANAGPLNVLSTTTTGGGTDDDGNPLLTITVRDSFVEFSRQGSASGASVVDRIARQYTVFFDHLAVANVINWMTGGGSTALPSTNPRCATRITVDNIASMDGTSMTLLISENENAGNWIWGRGASQSDTNGTLPVASRRHTYTGNVYPADDLLEVESHIGFCFPNELVADPTYLPNGFENVLWRPLYSAVENSQDIVINPLFINEGRAGANILEPTRTARPSSGHPGVVVAAFADGSVRPIRDDINRTLFVQLMRPGSGVIINPKDLGL